MASDNEEEDWGDIEASPCSLTELYNLLAEDILVVDCRGEAAYEAGAIACAQNYPPTPGFSFHPEFVERQDVVVVYGHSSKPSAHLKRVIEMVEGMPRTKRVLILHGGYAPFSMEYPTLCTGHQHYQSGDVYPSRITEFIFLSGFHVAGNKRVLQALRIGCILNMTRECRNEFEGQPDNTIKYLQIPCDDSDNEPLYLHFATAIDFIKAAESQGIRVLVHCAQGRSRSATIVLARLLDARWSLADAMDHVRRCRPIVQPNDTFMEYLRTREREISASR